MVPCEPFTIAGYKLYVGKVEGAFCSIYALDSMTYAEAEKAAIQVLSKLEYQARLSIKHNIETDVVFVRFEDVSIDRLNSLIEGDEE